MLLTVAVIGPAHALKGEVRLEVRTDDPEGRLAPGSVLPLEAPRAARAPQGATLTALPSQLTVSRLRFDGTRWFATFVEAPDRTAAEALRGARLLVETDEEEGQDEDAWYAHELIGLSAQRVDGQALGTVTALEPGVAQDRLVVRTPEGLDVAVPFVEQIVPEVDVTSGTVLIDPPGGLFPGLGQAEEAR